MAIFRKLLVFSLYIKVFALKLDFMKKYDFHTHEALIFKHCEKNYDTIITYDDSKQLDLMWLHQLHQQFHTVILLKESTHYPKSYFDKRKVDAILITISSFEKLKKIYQILYQSRRWDVMIPVYVLNLPDNNCQLASKILQRMWRNRILTSYYLCIENDEVLIYTYNPFTNRAPSSWTEVQIIPAKMKWTLYQRQYYPETICQELNFDRTEHLDGYPIMVIAPIADETNRSFEGQLIKYNDLLRYGTITETRYHFILDVLAMKLNVCPFLYVMKKMHYDNRKNLTYIQYVTKEANKLSAQLLLINFYLSDVSKTDGYIRTYPLAWSENGIATYNRGYRTLAEKVWDFYGFWTILFTIFILLITFIVIWYTESKKTSFAVFEIIRLLISNGLYTRMNTLSLRIFFITVLIYFLIIQATFNGHLANFLTKPELRRHAETYEDLTDLGYTKIYNMRYVQDHLAETKEKKVNYDTLVELCLNNILYNDSSVACILNHNKLLKYSQSEKSPNFYFSKISYETLYLTYWIQRFWSLLNRINTVIMSLEELGFRQLISGHQEHILSHQLFVVEARSQKDFQPIKLENLIFAFSILAVGLISATLCFCVEMSIRYRSKWNVISQPKNFRRKTLKIINRMKFLQNFRR